MNEVKSIEHHGELNFQFLVDSIHQTDTFFVRQVQKQVNIALTLRNWLIGFYIFEYEQRGNDRAAYGQQLYSEIAKRLNQKNLKSIRERHLYLCKDFYKCYPEILRTASAKFYLSEFQAVGILRTMSAESESLPQTGNTPPENAESVKSTDLLLNRLSFSHFIELIHTNTSLQRNFYEVQTIANGWSVRDLKRAINSMLFERTGLSSDKKLTLELHKQNNKLEPEDVFRNPIYWNF